MPTTITLGPNETSSEITVDALKIMSVQSDQAIQVFAEEGALISDVDFKPGKKVAILLIPPSHKITIKAFNEGATVTYHK
jgi:hypothetical protein